MKTKELLDKYRRSIVGLLGDKSIEPKDVKFFVRKQVYDGKSKSNKYIDQEIGELDYEKPKEWEQIQDWMQGDYTVKLKNNTMASFKLYAMPHCCAIIISCNAFVAPDFRNKRIGSTMNHLRQDIGRALGYSTLMCTDIDSNICQRKLLKTNGWTDVHNVINKRTQNRVYISVINL